MSDMTDKKALKIVLSMLDDKISDNRLCGRIASADELSEVYDTIENIRNNLDKDVPQEECEDVMEIVWRN